MGPCHPQVERVVHEQIRQNLTDHTTLRSAAGSCSPRPVLLFRRRRQPSFDVEQRPLARHVLADGPQHELVIDVVEQALKLMSNSRTQSYFQHRSRVTPTASSADFLGR